MINSVYRTEKRIVKPDQIEGCGYRLCFQYWVAVGTLSKIKRMYDRVLLHIRS